MIDCNSLPVPKKQPQTDVADALLHWYDHHRRTLPWRAGPGERPDPYRVWLSEIMLQQTTVATVTPRYARFVERWPYIAALAAAPLDDILAEWAGLGYYARARNLHRCARVVVQQDGFPDRFETLKALPGVGDYTAAAIAAIAFNRAVAVVDGNVERIIARLYRLDTPVAKVKPLIRRHVEALLSPTRPGDFAQAMMDLGATICKPRTPQCHRCPIRAHCGGQAAGDAADYPKKAPKKVKPTRKAYLYWLEADGHVLVERRPETGLLGGMLGFPSSNWAAALPDDPQAAAPVTAGWSIVPGRVRHTFTHFHFDITVMRAALAKPDTALGRWLAIDDLNRHALPTVMMKVARHVSAAQGSLPIE